MLAAEVLGVMPLTVIRRRTIDRLPPMQVGRHDVAGMAYRCRSTVTSMRVTSLRTLSEQSDFAVCQSCSFRRLT